MSVIIGLCLHCAPDLTQVVFAHRALTLGFGLGQNRKNQRSQNAYNDNHRQQLNQSEASMSIPLDGLP